MDHVEFRKIPRLSREIIVTEKLDGTNAVIGIEPMTAEEVTADHPSEVHEAGVIYVPKACLKLRAGSKNRWLSAGDDNFGFRQWVARNSEELAGLGTGLHYGEWWGVGIQRNYGLSERRFSLFNVSRWGDELRDSENAVTRPSCCHVVPVLQRWPVFHTEIVENTLSDLRVFGSKAAPGFMKPEGVIVFHGQGNVMFKKTLEKDDEPKGRLNGRA